MNNRDIQHLVHFASFLRAWVERPAVEKVTLLANQNNKKADNHRPSYYELNKEKLKTQALERYYANRNKCIERSKKYYRANREKILLYMSRYNERKIPKADREAIRLRWMTMTNKDIEALPPQERANARSRRNYYRKKYGGFNF